MEDVEFKPTKNSRRFFFSWKMKPVSHDFLFHPFISISLCWSNFIQIYMVHYKNPYHPSVSLSSWWPKKSLFGPLFAQMLHNTVWLKCSSQSPPTYHPFRSPRNVGWFPLQKLRKTVRAPGVQFQEIPTRNLELATADTDTIDPNLPILQGVSFSLLIVFCLPVAGGFFSPSRKVGAKSLSNAQDRWYDWYALMFVLYILICWPY